MLYDLATEPPEPGTLLESVFLLVSLRRREAELLQTEALALAPLVASSGKVEVLTEALKAYKNALFPFLPAEVEKEKKDIQEALKRWTERGSFRVKPLWMAGDNRRINSQLRRSAEKTKLAEDLRRKKRHTRL